MKHQEQITEIDSDGKIKSCDLCGNPNPGIAHDCIYFLKTRLARFGGHTAECDSLEIYVMGWKGEYGEEQVMRDPVPECDCGWTELEKWLSASWGVDRN